MKLKPLQKQIIRHRFFYLLEPTGDIAAAMMLPVKTINQAVFTKPRP